MQLFPLLRAGNGFTATWRKKEVTEMGKPWSPEEIELAKRLFDERTSETDIASKVGALSGREVSPKAVRSLLNRQHRAPKMRRRQEQEASRQAAYGEILRMQKDGKP